MNETENLIVGLGIAGLNLCHQLEKAGRSFAVIDNCPSNSASLIAGGIYNPIALKRKQKSWKVEELFPCLIETYSELDKLLGTSALHHHFPIHNPIMAVDDLNSWRQAIGEGRLKPYVNSIQDSAPEDPFSAGTIASVIIQNCGFHRIGQTILAYRKYLKSKSLLFDGPFAHLDVSMSGPSVQYRDFKADRIIFAEGRFISENPYFRWLPFRSTKGQMITVKPSATLRTDRIYNHQFFLLPGDDKGSFRLGATYEWEQLNEKPTPEATKELLSKAEKALSVTFEVMDEQAAIRPTVIDRRPVIGVHPEHKNLFLFNGMGTKGVMLAPYFAKQLVQFIYETGAIDPEANLDRFLNKFYSKN